MFTEVLCVLVQSGSSTFVHQMMSGQIKGGICVCQNIIQPYKKKWCTDTWYHIEEPRKHYIKWKKPDTEGTVHKSLVDHIANTG